MAKSAIVQFARMSQSVGAGPSRLPFPPNICDAPEKVTEVSALGMMV